MGRVSNFIKGRKEDGTLKSVSALGIVGAGADGLMNYSADQAENPEHSQAYSLAESAVVTAGWLFAEPLMWGITLGGLAADGTKAAIDDMKDQKKLKDSIGLHVRRDETGLNGGTLGGNFIDNQEAYTMRQRQMDVLRQHKISTESILGSEARQLHR